MAKGTHRAPRRTFGTVALVLTMVMMMVVMAFAPVAGADVPRYQLTTTTYKMSFSLPGSNVVWGYYSYWETLNPCDGTYSRTGDFVGATWPGSHLLDAYYQTVSEWVQADTTLTFRSSLAAHPESWFDFDGTWDGTKWVGTIDANSPAIVFGAELTPMLTESSDYKNHGEYVSETMDEYGPDAHSCIGMPIVSNKNG